MKGQVFTYVGGWKHFTPLSFSVPSWTPSTSSSCNSDCHHKLPCESQYIHQSMPSSFLISITFPPSLLSITTPIASLGPISIPTAFKLRFGLQSQSKVRVPSVQLQYVLPVERWYNLFKFEPLSAYAESWSSYAAGTHPGTQTHSTINVHNQPTDHHHNDHCYLQPQTPSTTSM